MAPIEFIGRYLNGFFDYGIADEVHELKGRDGAGQRLGHAGFGLRRTSSSPAPCSAATRTSFQHPCTGWTRE
jgi:hypothetical protein